LVSDELNTSGSTVWYNLRKLKRDGLVSSKPGQRIRLSRAGRLLAIYLLSMVR
jgi:Mn-dependent DtxR family transcriptional regulator